MRTQAKGRRRPVDYDQVIEHLVLGECGPTDSGLCYFGNGISLWKKGWQKALTTEPPVDKMVLKVKDLLNICSSFFGSQGVGSGCSRCS